MQDRPFSIYGGGELFDHKHLFGNRLLKRYVHSVSDGRYLLNLPQDLVVEALVAPIRNLDYITLMSSDGAVLNFDGPDVDAGTAIEFSYAKWLDLPTVILRTDFRQAGEGLPDSDPFTLMASKFPRTRIVLVPSMVWYHEALQAGEDQAVQDAFYTRLATAVIENLDAVRQEPPLMPGALAGIIYRWALDFAGAGLELTPDTVLTKILRRKSEQGLLPEMSFREEF